MNLSYLDLNMVNVIPENDIKRSNKPAINSKQGWEASFAEMHKNGDDKLLIDSYFEDEKL